MPFDPKSMPRKFERMSGVPSTLYRVNNRQLIRDRNTAVTLSLDRSLSDLGPIRDWCDDNFGDDWIYEWATFYFVNEKDAMLFALKWV